MQNFEERLRELGIMLPSLPTPIANYVHAKRVGDLIFTAGQVSIENGREYKGKLGIIMATIAYPQSRDFKR